MTTISRVKLTRKQVIVTMIMISKVVAKKNKLASSQAPSYASPKL